jgi:hypothetical protein
MYQILSATAYLAKLACRRLIRDSDDNSGVWPFVQWNYTPDKAKSWPRSRCQLRVDKSVDKSNPHSTCSCTRCPRIQLFNRYLFAPRLHRLGMILHSGFMAHFGSSILLLCQIRGTIMCHGIDSPVRQGMYIHWFPLVRLRSNVLHL